MDAKIDLAVVIPTLNAAGTLPRTLAALGPVTELVISDGGSTDDTLAHAHAAGATVITAPRGRGSQIAAGIATTTRPWLLVLHADTRLSPGWQAASLVHMQRHPDQAGWYRFALDSPDPRARRLERMVGWRCRVLALPYGDQGLLIHRDLLENHGGMRPLPLMEDVDLVRRLGRRHLRALPAIALTSAARWQRDGWTARSLRNLLCLTLWFLGIPPHLIVRLYR